MGMCAAVASAARHTGVLAKKPCTMVLSVGLHGVQAAVSAETLPSCKTESRDGSCSATIG